MYFAYSLLTNVLAVCLYGVVCLDNRRFSKPMTAFVLLLIGGVAMTLPNVWAYYNGKNVYVTLTIAIGTFLSFWFATGDKILNVLKTLLLTYVVSAIVEFGFVIMFYIFKDTFPNWQNSFDPNSMAGAIYNTFYFVINVLIALIYSSILKKNGKDLLNSIGMISPLLAVQPIFLALFFFNFSNDDMYVSKWVFFLTMFASWFIFDVACVIIVYTHYKKTRAEIDLENMEVLNQKEVEYYDNLSQSIMQARKYRHDFKNALTTISYLLDNSGTKEDAQKMLSEMQINLENTKITYYCDNVVANAVFSDKTKQANKNGIEFEILANIPSEISVTSLALCKILTNLIDNAFEACIKCKNPFVKLDAWIDGEYLYIKCVNSMATVPTKKDQRLVSSKKGDHGHGVSIVRAIAQENGGDLILSWDKEFVALCTVKI